MAKDATKELFDVMETITKLSKSLEKTGETFKNISQTLDKFSTQIATVNKVVTSSYGAWVNWNQTIYDTSKALSMTLGETRRLEESIKSLSKTTVYSQDQIAQLYKMRAQNAAMATMNEKDFAKVVQNTSDLFGQQGSQVMQTFRLLIEQNKAFQSALSTGQSRRFSGLALASQAMDKVGYAGALQFAQAVDYAKFGPTGNEEYIRNVKSGQELQKQMANLNLEMGREISPTVAWGQRGAAYVTGGVNAGFQRVGLPGALLAGEALNGAASAAGAGGGGGAGGGLNNLVGGGFGGGGSSAETINIVANVVNLTKGGGAGGAGIPGVGGFAPEGMAAKAQSWLKTAVMTFASSVSGDRAGKELATEAASGKLKTDKDFYKYVGSHFLPRFLVATGAGYRAGGGLGAAAAALGFAWTFKKGYETQEKAIDKEDIKEQKGYFEKLTAATYKLAATQYIFNERIAEFGIGITRGTGYAKVAQAAGMDRTVVASYIRSTMQDQKMLMKASYETFDSIVRQNIDYVKLTEGRNITYEESAGQMMMSGPGKAAFESYQQSVAAMSKGQFEIRMFVSTIAEYRQRLAQSSLDVQAAFGASSSKLIPAMRGVAVTNLAKFQDILSRFPAYIEAAADPNNAQGIERLTEALGMMKDNLLPVGQALQQWIDTINDMPVALQRVTMTTNAMADASKSLGRPLEVIQGYRYGQFALEAVAMNIQYNRYREVQDYTASLPGKLATARGLLSSAELLGDSNVKQLTKTVKDLTDEIKLGPKRLLSAQQQFLERYNRAAAKAEEFIGESGLTGAASLYFSGLESRKKYSEILPVSAGLQYSIRQEQLAADVRLRDDYKNRIDELLAAGYGKTNVHVQKFLSLYYEQHAKVYSDIMDLWGGFSGRLEAELDRFINGPQDILNWMPRAADIASMNIPLYGRFPAKVGSVGEALRTEPFLRTTEMAQMFKGQIPLMNAGVPWDNSMFHMPPQGPFLAANRPVRVQDYLTSFAEEMRKEVANKNEFAEGLEEFIEKNRSIPVHIVVNNTSPSMTVPGTGLVPR